jgi:hypothetical protein
VLGIYPPKFQKSTVPDLSLSDWLKSTLKSGNHAQIFLGSRLIFVDSDFIYLYQPVSKYLGQVENSLPNVHPWLEDLRHNPTLEACYCSHLQLRKNSLEVWADKYLRAAHVDSLAQTYPRAHADSRRTSGDYFTPNYEDAKLPLAFIFLYSLPYF